jgi:alkylhydroperoxidase family enzyme
MARIPFLHEDSPDTPAEVRDLLLEAKRRRGLDDVPNVYRALANHPALLKHFIEFYATARGGGEDGLTAAQCELAYLAASYANSCYY